jgi:catechol 2,3-dioxygenase
MTRGSKYQMDTPEISPSTQFKLPEPNLDPPFNITRASHMAFTARDLAASRDFYVEVVGLVVSDEDADTIWLRGLEERCHHSLTLKRTKGRPECERIGFRVFTEEDLDKAKSWLDGRGLNAIWAEVPFQGRTLHFNDPMGTPVELCATMPSKPRLHTKIHLHRGAAAMRMDHYQVLVPDVMAASKFYMDLGFRISDYIGVESTDIVVGAFLHRKNNPWDIVFLTRSGPRYHHAGFVVESTNAIIRACDVAGNLGFADLIEHGPGRHGHTHSYYCYMRDPDGHRVELLLPGIQVIDIDDEPELFLAGPESTTNLWGLPPPRSWVEEATNFAGVTLRRLDVEGGPMTAEEYLAKRLPARVVAALDTVGF